MDPARANRKWIRFRCDLRLRLRLCPSAGRLSALQSISRLPILAERGRGPGAKGAFRGFDIRFTAVSLEFVRVLVFVRWRGSLGDFELRGAHDVEDVSGRNRGGHSTKAGLSAW